MALLKFGSLLKIASTGLVLEDVVTEKTPTEIKEIETKKADFLYFRARAISAGDQGPEKGIPNPNGNGDYFPRKELEASYTTFAGRQLFLNHESDHPIKSIGKILDAYEVEDPETGEYYVECLAKIDRKLHPEMARKVETGELNTVSMGCSCEASMCSVCGTTIHTDNDEKCAHLEPSGILKEYTAEVDLPQYGIKKGSPVKAFSINSGLVFNELSIVNVPADAAAFIKTIISSNLKNKISKKASLDDTEKTHLQALLSSLDEVTKKAIQEEFCACAMPKEEQKMSDKEIKSEVPVEAKAEDTVNDVLQKLNGLEYHRLASWMEKKMVKASAPAEPIVEAKKEEPKAEDKKDDEDKEDKEKTAVEKAIDSVKQSFLGKLFSKAVKEEISKSAAPVSRELRAEFTKAENFGDSSWTLYRGDKKILRAFVKNAFNEEDLNDAEVVTWIASKEYGDKLVATYKQIGFIKTAQLLGVGFKKVEATSAEEKSLEKSYEAINTKDQSEVGTHLDSSKPEGDKEAAKEVVQEKKADLPPVDEAPMDAPKEEVMVVDKPEEALPTDAPKAEVPGEEKHESAFDKIDDKLIISEGVEAHKDKETNEIVVTDASGSEMKRLPDGFGDDVPAVLKLLQSIVGVEDKEDALAPVAPDAPVVEEPAVEEPASPMIPDMNKEENPVASKKENLTKEAEEIAKKAEELSKKEAELKKLEQKINNEKFASALNARTERCKKIVSTMVAKDLLPMDEATLTSELQKGETLLDARKTALEVAIKNKVKALLSNDDSALAGVESTIQGLKKSASKLSTPVSLDYVVHTEDDDLNSIFNSMGK